MKAMALKRPWLQIMLSTIIHAGSCKCTRSYSRSSRTENMAQEACFFSGQLAGTDGLHQATFQMDSRVRACAVLHEDTELLRRLSAGDMVALEAKYHTKRLMGLCTVMPERPSLKDQSRMEQLEVKLDTRVHSTRLKQRLLVQFPDMRTHNKRKDILMAFEEDVGAALAKA